MAKKKGSSPVAFNTAQAKAKWDSLEGRVDASLEALVAGRAKPSDIQNIGQALKGMSSAAHQVFEEAVDAAKASADAAAMAASQVGHEMTPAEHTEALNKALLPQVNELLAQIQQIVEIESASQTEELKDFIGRGFDDLYSAIPHPEDIEEALENATDDEGEPDENRNATYGDFLKLHGRINDFGASMVAGLAAIPVLLDEQFDKLQNFLSNKYELEHESDHERGSGHTDTSRSGTTANPSSSSSSVVPAAGARSDAEKREEEADKAQAWWKALGEGVFGNGKKKKKKGNWLTDILQDLGTMGILTSIFDPEFWTSLGKKMEDSITWDNLKGAFFASWDWIKDKTGDTLNWILEKLGITQKTSGDLSSAHLTSGQADRMSPVEQMQASGGPSMQAAYMMKFADSDGNLNATGQALWLAASPEVKKEFIAHRYDAQSNLQRLGRGLSDAGKFLHLNPSGTSRSQQEADLKTLANGGDVNAPVAPGTKGAVGNTDVNYGVKSPVSTTTIQDKSPTPQRASLTTSATLDAGETEVSVDTPRSQNSTTVPLPGAGASDPGAGQLKPPLPVGSSGAVGLDSFGFTQGTSDGLLLMNSSFLGH